MFTGIVTAVGEVRRRTVSEAGLELGIVAPFERVELGESIAVDGACLTVQALEPGEFTVHIIRTSLDRTNIETYDVGRRVNLERALRLGDRLGGHMVQGHVDGVGIVERVTVRDDARLLDLRIPGEVAAMSVPLGSITVDGVSLTINGMPTEGVIQVSLIPFTLQETTLGERRVGDRVHLEADMLGKYVKALLERRHT
jgi:riboflavin synthase